MKNTTNLKKQDYDSPWKQIIEELLESFLKFFFPQLYTDIDFSRGYEIKSKELFKLLKEHEIGKRYADELIKVYLKDGSERWLLIHIEVQSYKEDDFARRMFIYYYRIFDKYNHQVISLVILTDDDAAYKPDTFIQAGWGFEHKFRFPLVKIIDFKNKEKELEKSSDPMAIVVLAQLKSLESRNNTPENKFDIKITLIRMLYRKGYNKEQIMKLLNFIDWLITLPEGMEDKVTLELIKIEEAEKMTYVTSFERVGEKRGEKRGIIKVTKKMLENGDKIEYIVKITGLTTEEVIAIKKEMNLKK